MTATAASLQNKDFTIIIDRSGSMATRTANGKSRWEVCQETTFGLASKVEKLDPDGIDVYTFAGNFNKTSNVTSDKVLQIFVENEPNGTTALHKVLADAFGAFTAKKKAGGLKENGDLIVVVTDGEPDDRNAVVSEIIKVSAAMDKDEELSVLFLQVGDDPGAKSFLKFLDDGLQAKGAKFDLVDTITCEAVADQNLTDVLVNAIND